MHELMLAQALVEQLERIRAAEHAAAVSSVTVAIGALAGVDGAALAFAFPQAAAGTALARTSLKIENCPPEVLCDDCGRRSRPEPTDLCCRKCASRRVQLTGGREVLIREVELDLD